MDDIVLNKVSVIEKCVNRIKEEYVGYEDIFEGNYTKQDSVVLNLERACQACIDLGMHIVRAIIEKHLKDFKDLKRLFCKDSVLKSEGIFLGI